MRIISLLSVHQGQTLKLNGHLEMILYER
jgi:hypothetical protein